MQAYYLGPVGFMRLAKQVLHRAARGVYSLERARHGRQQVFDRLLAALCVGSRFGTCLAKPCLGQMKKRLIVLAQRLGAQRCECIAERRFGALPRLLLFRMGAALALQLDLKTNQRWSGHQPRNESSERQPDGN